MSLSQTINSYFSNLMTGKAHHLKEEDAWIVINNNKDFGVAVEYDGEIINESFENVKFYSTELTIANKSGKYLMLVSNLTDLKEEFSFICEHFIEYHNDKSEGKKRIEDPFIWWNQWKELIGNAVRNPAPHALIAEMISFLYLSKIDDDVRWLPSSYQSHDLTSNDKAYEVKSSLSKYDNLITINSQFQLKDLDYVHFVKLEKDLKGVSINDLINRLVGIGIKRAFLEKEMGKIGYPEGGQARKEKYSLLEIREYEVDENFPGYQLNEFLKTFKDPNVIKITYEIDLNSHPYKILDFNA